MSFVFSVVAERALFRVIISQVYGTVIERFSGKICVGGEARLI